MGKTITITSGKGGVGKTNICLNLALALQRAGRRVCVFDADLGLANINILLGIYPEHSILDCIKRGKSLQEILISMHGIDILPGASGVEEIANLDVAGLKALFQKLAPLQDYDFLLFDTSAGISRSVLAFCLASSEVVLVITPEPTSLTDSYSLLKVLLANGFTGTVKVVVNQCRDQPTAKETYRKFKSAVDKFLDTDIEPLGPVYLDERVVDAVRKQQPYVLSHPDSIAAKCIGKLAERLLGDWTDADASAEPILSFWRRCLKFFVTRLDLPGRERKAEASPEEIAAVPVVAEEPPPEPKQMQVPLPPPQEALPARETLPAEGTREELKEEPSAAPPESAPEAANPPAAPQAAVPRDATADAALMALVEVMAEGVTSISRELQLIREHFERSQTQGDKAPHGGILEAERILLDLEGFLGRHGKSREDA